jgi:hypothetical protein
MKEIKVLLLMIALAILAIEGSQFLGRNIQSAQEKQMRLDQIELTRAGIERQKRFIEAQKRKEKAEENGSDSKYQLVPEFNSGHSCEGTGEAGN